MVPSQSWSCHPRTLPIWAPSSPGSLCLWSTSGYFPLLDEEAATSQPDAIPTNTPHNLQTVPRYPHSTGPRYPHSGPRLTVGFFDRETDSDSYRSLLDASTSQLSDDASCLAGKASPSPMASLSSLKQETLLALPDVQDRKGFIASQRGWLLYLLAIVSLTYFLSLQGSLASILASSYEYDFDLEYLNEWESKQMAASFHISWWFFRRRKGILSSIAAPMLTLILYLAYLAAFVLRWREYLSISNNTLWGHLDESRLLNMRLGMSHLDRNSFGPDGELFQHLCVFALLWEVSLY